MRDETIGCTAVRMSDMFCGDLVMLKVKKHMYIIRILHSFTCQPHTNHTCFYSPAARRPAFWLVLIAPTHKGMARLS